MIQWSVVKVQASKKVLARYLWLQYNKLAMHSMPVNMCLWTLVVFKLHMKSLNLWVMMVIVSRCMARVSLIPSLMCSAITLIHLSMWLISWFIVGSWHRWLIQGFLFMVYIVFVDGIFLFMVYKIAKSLPTVMH